MANFFLLAGSQADQRHMRLFADMTDTQGNILRRNTDPSYEKSAMATFGFLPAADGYSPACTSGWEISRSGRGSSRQAGPCLAGAELAMANFQKPIRAGPYQPTSAGRRRVGCTSMLATDNVLRQHFTTAASGLRCIQGPAIYARWMSSLPMLDPYVDWHES